MPRHAFWVLVALGLGASLTWVYRTEIFNLLLAPAGGQLSSTGRPIFTGPTEMFALTADLVLKGGIIAATPVVLYSIYDFLRTFLGKQRRRLLSRFFFGGFFLYIGGTAFAYFILLPAGMGFLLHFGADIATPSIRISEYIEMALMLVFWLGVAFELPLIMLLLAMLRIVSYRGFMKLQKFVPFFAIILGGIITPTMDMVNLFLVAVPIWALY